MKNNNICKFILVASLAFCFLCRLDLLINMPAWSDEVYSVWVIKHSIAQIFSGDTDPVHPPGYYLILKLFSQMSDHLYWLRFLSFGTFLLNCLLLHNLGTQLYSKKVGLIWIILYSFSGYFLVFDWQARMYTPTLTFILLSLILLDQYLHMPKKTTLITFIITHALGLYLDYAFAWYLLPALFVISIHSIRTSKQYEIGFSLIISLIIFILLYSQFFNHFINGINGIDWMKPYLNPQFFIPYFLGNTSQHLLLSICIMIIVLLCAWFGRKNLNGLVVFVGLAALTSGVSTLIFSYLVQPLFHFRSLQIIPLAILFVVGIGMKEMIEKKHYLLCFSSIFIYITIFLFSFDTIINQPSKAMIQIYPWKKIIHDYGLNDDNILVVYNQTNHGFSPMLTWGLDYSLSGKDRFAKPIKHYESTKLPSGYTCSTIDSHFVIVNKCLKE